MSDEVGQAEAGEVDRSPSLYDRWLAVRENELTVAVLAFLGVFLAPFVLVFVPDQLGVPDMYVGWRNLVILTLIWGIFAIGYDLLLGFTGLLSFGHAMFWGTAAYTAGIFSANVTGSPLAMIFVGTTAAVVLAWVIGWISLRRGGIYFAILTLAFGQMIYYIAQSPLGWLTGGENGFNEVQVDPLLGFLPSGPRSPSSRTCWSRRGYTSSSGSRPSWRSSSGTASSTRRTASSSGRSGRTNSEPSSSA
ncbi:branched-chain amino acid ABC transporter permease [Halosimplex aquaticum]